MASGQRAVDHEDFFAKRFARMSMLSFAIMLGPGVSDSLCGMSEAVIYTDGACSHNPGPGGWGAVLRYGTVVKELHGGEPLDDQQPDGA